MRIVRPSEYELMKTRCREKGCKNFAHWKIVFQDDQKILCEIHAKKLCDKLYNHQIRYRVEVIKKEEMQR